MKRLLWILFVTLITGFAASASSSKITKEKFDFVSKQRTYYLYVPGTIKTATPAPLIVLLHGSNRNGLSLVEKWKELADKEGIILAGPDATDSARWSLDNDGTEFLHELVSLLKATHQIDSRRVYLFGHSAGAIMAILISMLESEYFAATAIHAGLLDPGDYRLIDYAQRKIPLAIFVGDRDAFFPFNQVAATRDVLKAKGFPVELTKIANHDHWYYDLAPKINQSAWDFLKAHALTGEPRYQPYQLTK
jgi:poly(3-hydroxybutyrate) depolymerase